MRTLDEMIEALPLGGEWILHKSQTATLPYLAKWTETIGHRRTEITRWGKTPKEAMEALLLEMGR